MLGPGPLRTAELVAGGAEQVDVLPRPPPPRRGAAADVVEDAQDADDGGGQDRGVQALVAGLVVERDVAAGDGDPELLAGQGQTLDGLGELPHDARVLGRTEVQAVGDREGFRPGRGHVAVGLGQRELGPGARVEPREAAVAVEAQRDAEVRLLVDAHDPRVVGGRERRAAHDVAVVLVGHPRPRAEVRRGDHAQQGGAQLLVGARAGQARRGCRPAARPATRGGRRGARRPGRRGRRCAAARRRRSRRATARRGARRR